MNKEHIEFWKEVYLQAIKDGKSISFAKNVADEGFVGLNQKYKEIKKNDGTELESKLADIANIVSVCIESNDDTQNRISIDQIASILNM